MREILAKIESDLQVCLNPDNIEQLKEKSFCVEESIIDLFVELIQKPDQFGALINLKVLKPLSKQIELIKNTLPYGGRNNYEKRKFPERVLFHLEELRSSIIIDHLKFLIDTSEYNLFVEREEKKIKSEKNSLLYSDFDFEDNEYINTISNERFINIVDEAYRKTLRFFEKSFEGDIDKELSKQNLVIFINRVYDKIIKLNKIINSLEDKIEKLENSDPPVNKMISFELEDGHTVEYNPLHEHWHNIVELIQEKNNNLYLKNKLEEFERRAFLLFPFLSDTIIAGARLKKSVFGNFNYDLLKGLYSEMNFYLRSEVREHHFIEIFTSNNPPSEIKTDLIEGTLGDFKEIINSLHTQFTNEFSDSNLYNQWWSDRFTFNGSEKDLQGIRRVRSSVENPVKVSHPFRFKLSSVNEVVKFDSFVV